MKNRKKFTIVAVIVFLIIGIIGGINYLTNSNSDEEELVRLSNGLMITLVDSDSSNYLGNSKSYNLDTIKLNIRNESDNTVTIGAVDFKAILSNGKTISPDSYFNGFYLEAKSGSEKQENLFFKVSKSERITKLVYQNDFKKNVELKVR